MVKLILEIITDGRDKILDIFKGYVFFDSTRINEFNNMGFPDEVKADSEIIIPNKYLDVDLKTTAINIETDGRKIKAIQVTPIKEGGTKATLILGKTIGRV
jgi:hypothetical protein